MHSDGELWRRAVAGDAECFGQLFDRHGDAVHRYCARRTGSLDAADDLVSIVFLAASSSRGRGTAPPPRGRDRKIMRVTTRIALIVEVWGAKNLVR